MYIYARYYITTTADKFACSPDTLKPEREGEVGKVFCWFWDFGTDSKVTLRMGYKFVNEIVAIRCFVAFERKMCILSLNSRLNEHIKVKHPRHWTIWKLPPERYFSLHHGLLRLIVVVVDGITSHSPWLEYYFFSLFFLFAYIFAPGDLVGIWYGFLSI